MIAQKLMDALHIASSIRKKSYGKGSDKTKTKKITKKEFIVAFKKKI